MLSLSVACGSSDDGGEANTEPATGDSGASAPSGTAPTGPGPATDGPSTADGTATSGPGDGPSTTDPSATSNGDTAGATTSGGNADCDFAEDFEGLADGDPWPAPWVEAGGVMIADVQGGRGRLLPIISGYSLARMYAPISCTDAEGTFTFSFTDDGTQGVGFYLRQNGGYLEQTTPAGTGYASFSEAFRDPPGVGLWHELEGAEMLLTEVAAQTITPGVTYAVRFRVTQMDAATTLLQTRLWPADQPEPAQWSVETMDAAPSLQSIAGGLAIDAWAALNEGMASDMFIDDIVVTGL